MQIPGLGRAGATASVLTVCAALAAAPAAMAGAPASIAGAPAARDNAVRHAPKHKLTAETATNWSGYSVDGTGATSVTGSWTVSKATCTRHETSWSSPWVGIDGDNNSTVEQTGTDTDCNGGSPYYYAWYEMYPKATVVIPNVLKAGDSMTGTVDYTGSGNFMLTLVNHTEGWSSVVNQTSTTAQRTSVEWIVEGPSNGTLTDFGTLSFTGDSATIDGGSNESLDQFGSTANAITMTGKRGIKRAAPGAVGSGGAFTDTWYTG